METKFKVSSRCLVPAKAFGLKIPALDLDHGMSVCGDGWLW